MTARLFRSEDLERGQKRSREFDPIAEGQRFGLAPEVSLAIWELVRRERAKQPDEANVADEERARQRFREIAARIAARGGRLGPDVGRTTRAGVELFGEARGARRLDDLRLRVPGRTTRVIAEEERYAAQDAASAARPETTRDAQRRRAASELPGAQDVADALAALQAMSWNPRPEQPERLDEEALQPEPSKRLEATPEPAAPDAEAATPERDAAAHTTEGATPEAATPDAEAERAKRRPDPRWSLGGITFDAAELVERVRQGANRQELPFQAELEQHFGQSLEFVETFTGEVAAMACAALSASAFAVRNVVVLGEANPSRELLLHELTHVIQTGGAAARAPRRFRAGSLEVGPEDSAAEREAYLQHASRPVEHASPNVIHRATKDKTPAAEANDRVADYIKKALSRDSVEPFIARDKRPDVRFGFYDAGSFPIRYLQSQRSGFTTADYEDAKGKEADLQQVVKAGGEIPKHKGFRLHKVGSAKQRWVITKSSAADYRPLATALKTPEKFKKAYLGDGKRGMSAIPKVAEKLRWGPKGNETFEAWDPAATEDEFSNYRTAIEEAIAAHYKGQPGGKKWHAFYEEVVLGPEKKHPETGETVQTGIFPHPYKRIVGNVFERLVVECVSNAGEFKVTGTQVVIYKKRKKGPPLLTAIADGKIEPKGGKLVLAEAKAWTQKPGSAEQEQAERYNDIIEGATSYGLKDGDAFVEQSFYHVVYFFSDAKVAELWKPMLDAAFGHDPKSKDYTKSKYTVVPPYPGHTKANFLIKYNPEFQIPYEPGKPVRLRPPPIKHAGLEVTALEAQVDSTGAVTSGTITSGINMAGALKVAPKREPLTVDKGVGVAPNRFSNLTGKLDRILGDRLKPSAEVNNEGVTASLDITPGKSGVPGFDLTAGRIAVTYTNDGALTATGSIGLSRKVGDGTISGEVTVSYSGKGFTVDGNVDVSAGVVEGLQTFKASFSYEGGHVTISADHAEYEKTIGGVRLSGSARALSYDTRSKKFNGEAQIDAALGPFGSASALATIKNSKVSHASFSYDSPELVYPKPGSGTAPIFTGTLGGTIKYEEGRLWGDIRGEAKLAVAGLKAISKNGEVGLAVHARLDKDGKFSGAIEAKTPLEFGKHFRIPHLRAKLDENGDASADVEVQLSGIKNVPDARLAARIDNRGFHLTGGAITLVFGDKEQDRIWGSVSASYQEGEGLVVAGDVNVKIKDGMVGTGRLIYSTKKGEGDALVKVNRIPLLEVKKRAKKLVEFEKQFIVFSFFGITLFLDTRFTLEFLYGLELGMTPSVEVKGIDLEALKFRQAIATIDVDGDLSAELVASPGVGLGLALFHPDLLSGHAGLKLPITAGAHLLPKTTLQATYDSEGGMQTGASLGMALNFGITGAVTAYAGLNVLMGAWEPSWEKQLMGFTIMEPRELFNWTLDLGAPIKKHDPALDDGSVAPRASAPKGPQPFTQTEKPGKPPEQPAPGGSKGSDNGIAAISEFLPQLKKVPEYQTLESILEEAITLWKRFAGVVGAIKEAVKQGLVAIKNGATFVGRKAWEGVKWVGGKVAWVGGKIADGAEAVWDHTGGALIDGIGSLF